jgi:hypothetical protein
VRLVRSFPEVLLIIVAASLIAVNVLLYAGVYAGVIVGENAIDARHAAASSATAAERAEQDASESLPGRFVPTQGRQHTLPYPVHPGVPFCPPDKVRNDCYASNPPSSGQHLPVENLVALPDGHHVRIPPDPGVYDFAIPREAVPHIEEHAGVYLGYNCASDDCRQTADRIKDLVTQEVSLGARVVMSPDPDLDPDSVGIAAWTRVDNFAISDYTDARVRQFIKAHSCRFDPEGFCPKVPVN